MVDKLQVENPLNTSMHYGNNGPIVNGVVLAPDHIPVHQLYSGVETLQLYNQMQKDLYISQQNSKPKKKGLPKILKILATAFGAYLLYAVAKPSVVNAYRKIFRK